MKKPKLTFTAFARWFKGQKGNPEYDYCSNGDCLMARFIKSQGFVDFSVVPGAVRVGSKRFPFTKKIEMVSHNRPWTYRAARGRLRRVERGEHIELVDVE